MILAIEKWLPIRHSANYEASDFGRVRNTTTGQILKPWIHKSGHLYLRLGRGKSHQVHHLILSAFGVVPHADGMECRHLDSDPANNRLLNLQWGTRTENIEDLKAATGRYAKASLSDEDAARIRAAFTGKHGEQTRIARAFCVSLSVVNRIVRGRTYADPRD